MNQQHKLSNVLLKKYHESNLASVYLARYKDQEALKYFNSEFVKKITPLEDHPDILWVTLTDKEQSYKVESLGIKALLKFINYRPFSLRVKFIFLQDAHLLSDIVANKLLKVFEELPKDFCLFLLTPQDETLLATVESRAIKINLTSPISPIISVSEQADNDTNQNLNLNEMSSLLKNSEDSHLLEKQFLVSKLNHSLSEADYLKCNDVLEKLKHYDASEKFNNQKQSRLALLF
ncbi:MAG: hypothetical protein HOP07_03745 [Bacteriovoracaceae bacterium]|nr:hypothetical protein [Bacteriovoracaceae bacterium]